ncbi:hypothetical protein [Chitinimonas sp. BJB300]|uniref:hypothetical protein n=1 Tax=Chitinimonas sp. BJB300 TaxID=1559339 RepID=UPI000C0CFB51|nr:hypothetical protein [Chitinimonas sp. BJB300]PHV10639.1 hypothetical protein CSQ89_15160 [Chitinimonas sp. BJB300]
MKHLLGIGFVVLLHLFVIYALVNGLARKVVEVIQKPLETKLIDEPPPPPPEEKPIPLPPEVKLPPPPPAYVPPPEVVVQAPVAPTNAPTAVSHEAPPEVPPQPPAPPVPVAPPAPVSARAVFSNYSEVAEGLSDKFSVVADKEQIQTAEVTLLMTVGAACEIGTVSIKSSTNSAVAALARNAVRRFKCSTPPGHEVQVLVPFSFKLQD